MRTKTISIATLSIIVAIAIIIALLSSAKLAEAASTFFGDASTVSSGGNPGYAAQIRSDTSVSPGYGGVSFDDANGTTFSSLATLSTDYNVTDDNCGGGSPRFQIKMDLNNNGISDAADKNIFVYIGPSPSFTGCATGWQSTGNLIGNNDAGRWDSGQIPGGTNSGTYAQALAAASTTKILGVSIVDDSSWSAAATGGDSEMTTLLDNTTINSNVYTFTPPDVTVTIVKFVDGVHATSANAATSSFPMASSWNATNIGSGSGTYSLSPVGFNNPNPYEATTANMSNGADYSTNEDTTGSVVGPDCAAGKPFALVGYTTGDSLAAAQAATLSTTSPALTNITTDKFIIVWNTTCAPVVPPPPANACDTPTVAPAGYTIQNGTYGNDNVTLAPFKMFVGFGGNDKVNGANGNFIVCGGNGNQQVTLGNGDATIVLGHGNQKVTVGDGKTTIVTGNGNQTIQTGNGDKNVTTGTGNDKITTGDGNDTINAGDGNNTINAGGGNDTITATNANDKIDGGAGTDSCSAGGGKNTVTNCE